MILLPATAGGPSRRGHSRLAALGTCPRLWYLRYVKRLRLKRDKSYRLLGTLIHLCLAYYYAWRMEQMGRQPPAWFRQRKLLDHLEEIAALNGQPKLLRIAVEVFRAYRNFAAGEPWIPVDVEVELGATLGEIRRLLDEAAPPHPLDDEQITARLDLVIEVAGGAYYIVDAKTEGKAWNGGDRLQAWKEDGPYRLDWQMLMQLLIARAHYGAERVRGSLINRVKRVAPYDFDRPLPLRTPPRAYADAVGTLQELTQLEQSWQRRIAAGEHPTPHFWACQTRYGPCDFIDICSARDKGQQQEVVQTEFTALGTGHAHEEGKHAA